MTNQLTAVGGVTAVCGRDLALARRVQQCFCWARNTQSRNATTCRCLKVPGRSQKRFKSQPLNRQILCAVYTGVQACFGSVRCAGITE